MIIVFRLIHATVGLRASAKEELEGLDVTEHGLTSAYADFLPIESNLGVHSDYACREKTLHACPDSL